ncbi:DUF6444 domain-containing protein [Nonomuraea sp. NPDC050680]|uniref:DUF6444 domain-containing protein n=1 Tax=Nonomuraea sp. NPDC050680 TaxID=3154630 RepID=UPI0034046578
MRASIAERDALIRALLAEVEQLKRRAGMDSFDSSMSPASEGPAARAKRAEKQPAPCGIGKAIWFSRSLKPASPPQNST